MPTFTFDTWLGTIGVVLGILGIASGYYFYRRSIKKPVPTYSVHPLRVRIVDKTRMTLAGLEVSHKGQPLAAQNVTAATLYFWNDGREPMRGSQVLTPYTIRIDGDIRILDCKITSLREVSRVSTPDALSPDRDPNALTLRFEIIEKSLDGAQIQIIYTGDPKAAVSMKGVIEGASEPKMKAFVESNSRNPLSILVLVIYMSLFIFIRVLHSTGNLKYYISLDIVSVDLMFLGLLAVTYLAAVLVPFNKRSVAAQFTKKSST